jgi:hypothetical protein
VSSLGIRIVKLDEDTFYKETRMAISLIEIKAVFEGKRSKKRLVGKEDQGH